MLGEILELRTLTINRLNAEIVWSHMKRERDKAS